MTSFLHRRLGLVGGLSIVLSLAFVPLHVYAQAPPAGGGTSFGQTLKNGLNAAAPKELSSGATNPSVIVGNVLSAALGLLGVVLFGYFLYGGYLWMTAAGDPGQVKTAMAVIKNAVIGLVIITLAYAIAAFVIDSLGNSLNPTQGAQPVNSA